MAESEERRQFLRTTAAIPVKYRVPTAPEAGERLGVTISVGGGGMCLSVTEPIAAGTSLDLHLMIPGEPKPIAMTAQVVWSESKAPERLLPAQIASCASEQLSGVIQLKDGVVASLCRSCTRPVLELSRFAICDGVQSAGLLSSDSNEGNEYRFS